MPRVARIVVPGWPHHLIQRGNNREKIFFDDEDRKCYLELIKHYIEKWKCYVYAYCLMPNHIHLLVEPTEEKTLRKMMQAISLCYTQTINTKYSRTGRLWECRYHSSIVDKDVYLWAVCRYIERNPVRANLVSDPREYNWSSAKYHFLNEPNPILTKNKWILPAEERDYMKYLLESESEKEKEFITKMTYKGLPITKEESQSKFEIMFNKKIFPLSRGRPKKAEK